ncbi:MULTISPECIES: class I adenylate-forming enzyme family protein [Arsenicicoccus]|uniref:class I adenylate-forming enzyme family protein n=1 Tax=Arsenicicoccus TaxID=267408 RepID=UPI00257B284B|nr:MULTISPECIES: AMP-binding protein [Arsenicicoccus]
MSCDRRPGPSLGATTSANALHHGHRAAYVHGPRIRTHRELLERSTAVTVALADAGVRHQDRVALLAKNSIEFGEVLSMAHVSGIVVATVNYRLSPAEIVETLRAADPVALFCGAEHLALLPRIRAELPGLELVVALDGQVPDGVGVTRYEDFLRPGLGRELPFAATADDVAFLIFTSGTTGTPKGCILGHRELRLLAKEMAHQMRSGCDDLGLLVMPLFHIGAMAIALGLHVHGGTAVLTDAFDPERYADWCREGSVTVMHLAPTMLRAVLDAGATPADLATVRTVVYSAAPMDLPTLRAAMAAMPRAGFLNLYGQTETITSGLPRELHSTSEDAQTHRRLSSVGIPFSESEVRLLGPHGADVAQGEAGEITVRTEAMFRGYWRDPVTTDERVREGWFLTGDVGRFDEEGMLHIVDRIKDVVISGGENIYCPEVERAVESHPEVAACAVIGVPDDRWGEAVCAVVVPHVGADALTADAVRDHVRARLAGYKVPKHVRFTDVLPTLVTGKVDKKALRVQST